MGKLGLLSLSIFSPNFPGRLSRPFLCGLGRLLRSGFGFALSTALAIPLLATLLSYVRADPAQKIASTGLTQLTPACVSYGKSARLRRNSFATSSTFRPLRSIAAFRLIIVSVSSRAERLSKTVLSVGCRRNVASRTTGVSR